MKTTLETLQTTLETLQTTLAQLREMTPESFASLDNDAWQLMQDVSDCCKAIYGRIETLDALAPVKPMDDTARETFVAQFNKVGTDSAYTLWENGPEVFIVK